MSLSHRVRLWVFVCLVGAVPTAAAQTTPSPTAPPPIAHVSALDGAASLDRDGITETLTPGWPLLPGDRIRTDSGRVEVLFAEGSALHLDQSTTADLLAADLIRLLAGRVYLYAAGTRDPGKAVRYQIDAPTASAQTNWPGQYRLAADDGRLELAVVSGEAVLATDAGSVTVRAGEQAFAFDGARPSAPSYFNSARWDTFDRWSASRRDERVGTASARYLPEDLQAYSGTFDRYGTWRDEPSVGQVWYPSVATDWRPYYHGQWRPYESWGSVWIGFDPWGWPTHHYGRWGFSLSFGWYWRPDRHWGPGWVSWVSAPGYVSWCPLGYHGGPVFAHWGLRGGYYGRVDPWRGWTVLPRHAYGRPVAVARYAVNGRHLDSSIRGAFVAHREPPRIDVAVPRAGARTGIAASARPRGGQPGASGGFGAPGTTGGSAMSRGAGSLSQRETAAGRIPHNAGSGLADPGRSAGRDIAVSRRFVPGAAAPAGSGEYREREPGQSPREALGGGDSSSSMDRATRRFPSESPGTSGMPGASRRIPTESPGASGMPGTSRRFPVESPGASGMPGTSRRFPVESPGASGMPGASRRVPSESPGAFGSPGGSRQYPSDRGSSSGGSAGASGMPGGSRDPASRRTLPGGSGYETPRSSQNPRSYESPRQAPRSYEAPRAYEPPRSAPRSSEGPRSYDSPRSAPRSYEGPRSYEAPRSAPRSYERPQPSDSGRSSGSTPRYNPGAGSRRDSAPSSSGSRRRSPRE